MSREDRREAILARLVEVLDIAKESGMADTYRNYLPEENDNLPAYVMLDGDERRVTQGNKVGNPVVEMLPEIYFVKKPSENKQNEDAGETLNAMRVKLMRAILSDGPLQQLTREPGYMEYRGFATDMHVDAEVEGHFKMDFAFAYQLDFNRL